VLAAVFFAPAAWLGAALPVLSHGHLLLQDTRGTVWTGSGRLLLTGGSGSRDVSALPGRLDWRLRPSSSGLTLALHAACCTPTPLKASVRLGWQTQALLLDNAVSEWPAALLLGLGTPFNTVQADGTLSLSTQQFVLQRFDGRLAFGGTAQLQALNISSRLSTVKPMGSYQVVLTGGSAPTLALSTLSGALKLSGNGNWVGSRLRFSGAASVEPEFLGAFTNLLNIIGRRRGTQSIITLG
jgi:general secretion pathway protein N